MPAHRIKIGHSNGREVFLGPERREVHTHVIGASGQGKSKFLEHCIQQDILWGHGVCLIDPEGDLYESIVQFCAELGTEKLPKVHLFDPTEPNWRFRFNPLHVHEGEKPRHRIDNVIEALAQVWGGEDSRNTPSIRTTLRAIFTVLVDRGYTLAEAFYLTSTPDSYRIVEYLTHDIKNSVMNEIWEGYKAAAKDSKTRREHVTEFGGSRRRFGELLADDEIREILGTYDNPIDFKQCMDNGEIVLINLSPEAMGDDPARAFGALFVREMFYCASRRNPKVAREKPFYAYIDECGEFLTQDITRILARSRKRGFHVTLAHQWLEQLRERGSSIYHGVMGIQNKVIFGGLSDDDATILADQLFRNEYDLEIPVKSLIKETVVGYQRIWLNNWSSSTSDSYSESDSVSDTESDGSAAGSSIGTSVVQNYDSDGFPTATYTITTSEGTSVVDSLGYSTSSGHSTSSSSTFSDSKGQSEALAPILAEMPTSVHSLENVRHMAISRLRGIPPRNAVVKAFNSPTFEIATITVDEPLVASVNVEKFKHEVFSSSPYTLPADEVRQLQLTMERDLIKTARAFEPHYTSDEEDDGLA